jgi:hypothetical protein
MLKLGLTFGEESVVRDYARLVAHIFSYRLRSLSAIVHACRRLLWLGCSGIKSRSARPGSHSGRK